MNAGKTIAVAAITLLAMWASVSHADVVTLKDTRTYAPFTSEISGLEGCTMPKNLDKPNLKNPNECRVKRSQRIVSGELLTRDSERSLCTRTVYSSTMHGPVKGVEVPEQEQRYETFKCDPTGAPDSAQQAKVVSYSIDVLREKSNGAVQIESRSSIVGLEGKTITTGFNTTSTYLVACTESKTGKPVSCGDEWTNSRQIAIHLTPAVGDGWVDTKVVILGGAGKGRNNPEPTIPLMDGMLRMAYGKVENLVVNVPGEDEKYLIQVTPVAWP